MFGHSREMDLTLIGFVIALVGIVLQISDAFPEHRETRKVIVLLSIGLFIGIAASAALGAKYQVTGNVDRRFALLYAIAGFAAFFGIVSIFVDDRNRRETALALAGSAAGIFILSGFFVAIGSQEPEPIYSEEEILILANDAEQKGRYELAIKRLAEMQTRTRDDEAHRRLADRIAILKKQQQDSYSKTPQ